MSENKSLFVKKQLQPLLIAIDRDIKKVEYTKEKSGYELVCITYRDGYVRKINVTGDSFLGVVKDVMKQVS